MTWALSFEAPGRWHGRDGNGTASVSAFIFRHGKAAYLPSHTGASVKCAPNSEAQARKGGICVIYDTADIDLLRLAGTVKNLPTDLPIYFQCDTLSPSKIHLMRQVHLLAENRNHLSFSLTPQGYAVLQALGYQYTADTRQPALAKLERRLQSARATMLFYRAGFNVYVDRIADLAESPSYLPSNALRRDTTSSTTRVFGGARYVGIAHDTGSAYLAHYIDDAMMYFSSEMRMFNTVTAPYACRPAVLYLHTNYLNAVHLLTGHKAFARAKNRGSDAATYRVAAERTEYPLHIIETTDVGARQLLMLRKQDYRARLTQYALQSEQYLPPLDDAPMLDALLGMTPMIVCVDMDLTRIRAAVKYARKRGLPSLAVVALPRQLDALALWFEDLYPIELYAIEETALEEIFPELALHDAQALPCMDKGGSHFLAVQ